MSESKSLPVGAVKVTAVIVRGAKLWRMAEGSRVSYTWRSEGQTEPSPWSLWSDRARDVSEGDVCGTGNRI